jgi:hypothetical protein
MTPITTTMTPNAAILIVPKRFCQSLLLFIPKHLGSKYSADRARHFLARVVSHCVRMTKWSAV